jgi:hypothetical protein
MSNATKLISTRVPPAYAEVVDLMAEALGVSTASLTRRALEHYALTVVAEQLVGHDLACQLSTMGETTRKLSRPSQKGGRPPTGGREA